MASNRFLSLMAGVALALSQTLAYAQDVTISGLIQGQGLAPSMKIKELPPEYRACKIDLAKGGSDGMSSLLPMMLMGGTNTSSTNGIGYLLIGSLLNSYWTKADTVKMGGFEYLVTYKLETGLKKVPTEAPAGSPLAVTLRLNLIRTDMIAAISPDPASKISDIVQFLDQAKISYDEPTDSLNVGSGEATNAAILYPVFTQAKSAARRTTTLSNVKQLSLAAILYSGDYDDVFPYVQGTQAAKYVFQPYLKNNDLWKSLNPAGGEFKMNMAVAGVNLVDLDNPAEVVLFYEENEWEDGKRCVSYADSHARVLDREGWEKAKLSLKAKFKRTAKPLPLNYGR